ncbi:MATE family efflux transporter [uncultured Clostridium sp.]|jgi:putative MATE family efflux protein|uniref:MATE family efflux transporter n=1 Tax=uncultured Clostridium sp. TaxID=59620 RepID=UPI0026347103|nr:MATE family efflux transporter [uncultured Clostridium sp.]
MDNNKELGRESIIRLLFKYSVPAIIAMMVNALYTVVDRMFIGRIPGVGAIAMSGVGMTMPIICIIMGIGMLIGVGSAASISIKLGQQKRAMAEKILGNAVTLTVISSVIITFLGILFSEDILSILGASKETLTYAKQFIDIILIGTIFNMLGFSLNQCIRSDGNPKIAMITMLIGAVINIILDPIFIFGFGWGIEGAAFATIVSQFVSAIWIILYFITGKSSLKLKKENLAIDTKLVKGICAIGMAPCAMQIAASMVQIVSNKSLITYGGDLAAGAMAIISSISMIFLMPIFGMNQGSQPIIGYNIGAKNYGRAKKAVFYPVIGATIVVMIAFLTTQLFPEAFIKMFNNDPKLVKPAVTGLRIYLCMLPVVGFQIICANYFQASGKAKIAMFLSLLRQVFFLIPLMLILPKFFGLNGVWLAGPISDLASAIVTSFFIYKEVKILNKLEKIEEKITNVIAQ